MHHKLGKELRQLIVWASVIILGLFALVVVYFMVDVAVTTSNNIDQNKQLVVEESVDMMKEMADNIGNMTGNADLMLYLTIDKLTRDLAQGNTDSLLKMMTDMALTFYPIDYVGLVKDGEVIAYQTDDGSTVDTSTLPTGPEGQDYIVLDSFGGDDGFFISLYYTVNLPVLGELQSNYIMDRTADITSIENYFNDQRNNQLLRMAIVSVVAFILFALIATLGLRFLVGKFVMRPIDALNEQATGIIEGTLTEEIPYDPESSFAPIQGVLQTGQKVLMEMLHGRDG